MSFAINNPCTQKMNEWERKGASSHWCHAVMNPGKRLDRRSGGEMMIVYVGKNRSETSESIVGEIIVLIGQSHAESFICFHHDRH